MLGAFIQRLRVFGVQALPVGVAAQGLPFLTEAFDIVCPCHEYRFDLRTGLNTTSIRLCEDQTRFPLSVVDGRVVVEIPDTAR